MRSRGCRSRLFQVAKDEIATAEPLLDRGDGVGKARVIGADETHLMQEKEARIHGLAVETSHEGVVSRAPCPRRDHLMKPAGVMPPVVGAGIQTHLRRDLAQPVAGHPAHHVGEGMHAPRSPELPWPRIRFIEGLQGHFAQAFQ